VTASPARYWSITDAGRIECELCPRRCRLTDGQRGLCFVRQRRGDELVLDTYGRSSGFCVDPIEKKPLSHFLPGTPVLSFGTAGCNLACKFCQNWDISKARRQDRLLDRARPEDIAAAAQRTGCASVAYTYNDPVIFLEYAVDTAAACRELGIRSVAVTAGYIEPAPRAEFFGAMDAANVDLKAFSESFYWKLTGSHIEPVKDCLRWLIHESEVWVEITTLLIPGANDSEAELHALASWVREELRPEVPLHFSAFHPDWKMRDRPPTPLKTLLRARSIALEEGLHYVYTGNRMDPASHSTWCHACGACVIGRAGYSLTEWNLAPGGRCRACGHEIPGIFEARPGDWGSRRMPLRVQA
jgi:pyruvate formate lyase activating enzyme